MRLNDWAAPEHSDSASEMSDFVSAAFASATVSEAVLMRHFVASYQLEIAVVSPLLIAPAV